ncbi:PAS domain-containing sensor histidine kinase [uncultured Candidatus Puniceispirillum sp.]|uniref:sensor histidine kinase NtrY-like n=1 Tax=uncultured Candidatus Puniceispirillum sp. TaxID=1985115 RepID=UPI0032B2A6E5
MSADKQSQISRRLFSEDRLAYISILFTVCMGAATAFTLSRVDYLSEGPRALKLLLAIDVVALLVLGYFVVRHVMQLWAERRQQVAGHQLHWRLAVLFGGITTLPVLIIALFSLFVVDYSLRGWFADRISVAINESVKVADSYFQEHAQSVTGDVLTMANDVNREALKLGGNRDIMGQYLSNQTALRNLSEAIIIDGTGEVIAKSRFAFAVTFTNLDDDWVEKARDGEVVVLRADDTNKIRAVVKLNSYIDAYLLVGRFIDQNVLAAVDRTRLAASDYQRLGIQQFDLQLSFAVLFGVVVLLLLISALWVGLNLATAIIGPLSAVINVADKVRGGDLRERVPSGAGIDEISRLGLSFNNMLDELARSRQQLVQANMQIDRRREFTEAVLGGVSSGVIGLDKDGRINLPNAAARKLLGLTDVEMIGKKLESLVPEFTHLLSIVGQKRRRFIEEQVVLERAKSRLTLRTRIASERVDDRIIGYVVTFDDVTDLLTAQRKAAWADIARRIAHEIKNPLTPIQLASDRLLRKFKPKDAVEADRFEEYVTIISRQVDDIGRMVDEFSSFARMPQPTMETVKLDELVEGQIDLFASDEVSYNYERDETVSFTILGDAGLLRQAITNLLQNAKDSLNEHNVATPEIHISLAYSDGEINVMIKDNGPGFPDMNLDDLLEPYVTTREKGTGLGLAIVSKIVQDHNGSLTLKNDIQGGAIVVLTFPSDNDAQSSGKNLGR